MTTVKPVDQCSPASETNPPFVLHARVVTGAGGGPEKTILNSPRFLKPLGYSSACLYLHPPNDSGFATLLNRAQNWQSEVIAVPDSGIWDLSVVREAIRVCRERNVKIWHAHDYKSNVLGLLVRRFHKMALVTTVHGWVNHTRRSPLYYWIDRKSLPFYDHVVCVSEDLYEQCRSLRVAAENCTLIDNAIDINEFQRASDTSVAKQRLGFSANRVLVGAVGRLAEEKGFHLLIQAVEQVMQSGIDMELIIIGDGEQRAKLAAQISASPYADRIHLLGFRADTIALYEAMDLFVLSSLREGLPNVLLEAMAMEVPVLATRIAGVPKLIQDQQNGRLIPAGSVPALTSTMTAVLQDPKQQAELRRAARKTIEEQFSFDVRMQKMCRVYEKVLAD